ncbi:MAG: UMP kinase [Candidatus Magasanikbacteria bacterium]|nr:UMP kinase [Candidatus Magasanikbacteria bacterium]
MNKYKIISVGGSIIIPESGFDVGFLKKFRALLIKRVRAGDRLVLVVGGGATCRAYQEAARRAVKLTATDLDWIGIKSTVLNAEFVRCLFKEYAHPEVISRPRRRLVAGKPIIVASGWQPGHSTDHDAVLLARAYGAKEIINLSNTDYVYDRDPRRFPAARKLMQISWREFRRLVGSRWTPGANLPFDPVAARHAARLGLTVKFVKGTNLPAVARALTERKFRGTIIS